MAKSNKYNQILDALEELLSIKELPTISVSDIAQTAGIGKGSIYYYFSSKDEILEALVVRSYEEPLRTAKNLADKTDISPFTRMALIFQACHKSSFAFSKTEKCTDTFVQEKAFLHQKYMKYLIKELKPVLSEIITQGVNEHLIRCEHPQALAEIVLIVLTVKIDNTLIPSTREEIEQTIAELISLLEKGTDNPKGSLNFLMADI